MTYNEQLKSFVTNLIDGDITAAWDIVKVVILLVATTFLAKPYAAFTGIMACLVMYNRLLKTISSRKEQESKTREQRNVEMMTQISIQKMIEERKREGITGDEPYFIQQDYERNTRDSDSLQRDKSESEHRRGNHKKVAPSRGVVRYWLSFFHKKRRNDTGR